MAQPNRQPYLVQSASTLQIGNNGNVLNSNLDTANLEVKDSTNTSYAGLTTGNLTVKGNLRVETGHVSEFDIGTAIFQDKMLELGASDYIYEGMSDGTGILAVDSLVEDENINISTNGSSSIIRGSVWTECRNFVAQTANFAIDMNITSASSAKGFYDILLKDSTFTQYCNAQLDEGANTVTITSKDSSTFTQVKINKYGGYKITYNYTEGGWSLDGRVYNSTTMLYDDSSVVIGPFGISQKQRDLFNINAKTVTVEDDYAVIADKNCLIDKKYFDENNNYILSPSSGLGKGLELRGGKVVCNTSTNPMGGIPILMHTDKSIKGVTLVCPWIQFSEYGYGNSFQCLASLDAEDGSYIRVYIQTISDTARINTSASLQIHINTDGILKTVEAPVLLKNSENWVQPVIVLNRAEEVGPDDYNYYIDIYNNSISLHSEEYEVKGKLFTSMTLGSDGTNNYEGQMIGEFIVLNSDLSEDQLQSKGSSGIWYTSSEQSNINYIDSGELTKGKAYLVNATAGSDFTPCGISNDTTLDSTVYCTTTASPVWGAGSFCIQKGALFDLVLKPLNDPEVDVLDLSHNVVGKFEGMIFHNETFPPLIGIQYTA